MQFLIHKNKLTIDFKSTKIDKWANFYLTSRKGWCQNVLINDGAVYDTAVENGTVVYVKKYDLLNTLCLNNCSSHGQCIDGF